MNCRTLPVVHRRRLARRWVRTCRGSALLVVALLLALAAAVTARLGREFESRRQRLQDFQHQQLVQARDRLLAWVAPRLGELDAQVRSGTLIDAPDLLVQAGVDPRSGIRLSIGPVQAGSGISYIPMALWWPAVPGDAPVWDGIGTFRAGRDPLRLLPFSTRDLEQLAKSDSLARLQALAQRAEARFAIKVETDPDHRIDWNWFRAPDGNCRLDADQFPCASDLNASGWPSVQALQARSLAWDAPGGADGRLARNGWGGDNLWTNDVAPAQYQAPPFSMAFATQTPWGDWLIARAVQPL